VRRFGCRLAKDLCQVFQLTKEITMTQWIKPQATDLRYGFEITMYISNR
jgi:coenzyme PQQ precursor peptide PqqA